MSEELDMYSEDSAEQLCESEEDGREGYTRHSGFQ